MNATSVSLFDASAILIVLAAVLGYFNHRFLKLPSTVGLTIMGAVSSLLVVSFDYFLPGSLVAEQVTGFLQSIDFHATLMEALLSFLLFAGALHVDWTHMRQTRWLILAFSTIGVLISTLVVGFAFHWLSGLLGAEVPVLWSLVFGALISPTDPVAVISVLKRAAMPDTLQATVAGESLFNDGIGVVVFGIILALAMGSGDFSVAGVMSKFMQEALGGIVLGLVIGWLAFRAMASIDDYVIEVMISLAVVMGGYSLAMAMHISGPVAMAVAGLLIGNAGVARAMSDLTQDYLIKFWELIDEVLNAILFLLIGLEVIILAREGALVFAGLMAIPLVLLARALSVVLPLVLLGKRAGLGDMALPVMVWGGLRGGISIALALALPEGPFRSVILVSTYAVVLFAVIIQGGTMGRLIARLEEKSKSDP